MTRNQGWLPSLCGCGIVSTHYNSERKMLNMSCTCEKCGKVCECGEKLCWYCFIEDCPDIPTKNLTSGGHFYGEHLIKEDKD